MAAHRDADVYRFALAHRVAREMMAAPAPAQSQVMRTDQGEVMTVSAKQDGAAGFLAMIERAKG